MFYDVRFDAIAPKSADSTEQEEVIRLIINVEAQTKFKPGYPLTKRAIYYCSRMISVQHGPIFTKSEYGKICKVYSIWICTQPSDGFENTLTRYSIKPEQLIGEAQEETENYDLMSVVMICLGKPGTENHKGIYSLYNKRQVDRLIAAYFTEGCDDATRIKIYCYIAACGLLWSNWCEYKRNLGVEFGEYSLRQYRYAKEYYRIVQDELKKQKESEDK